MWCGGCRKCSACQYECLVACGKVSVWRPTTEGLEIAGNGIQFSFELITFGNWQQDSWGYYPGLVLSLYPLLTDNEAPEISSLTIFLTPLTLGWEGGGCGWAWNLAIWTNTALPYAYPGKKRKKCWKNESWLTCVGKMSEVCTDLVLVASRRCGTWRQMAVASARGEGRVGVVYMWWWGRECGPNKWGSDWHGIMAVGWLGHALKVSNVWGRCVVQGSDCRLAVMATNGIR